MATLTDWNGSAEDSDWDLKMDEIDHGSDEPSWPNKAVPVPRLIPLTPLSIGLDRVRWGCSCGRWETDVPVIGQWGHYSSRARMGRVTMAHKAHVAAAHYKENQ